MIKSALERISEERVNDRGEYGGFGKDDEEAKENQKYHERDNPPPFVGDGVLPEF